MIPSISDLRSFLFAVLLGIAFTLSSHGSTHTKLLVSADGRGNIEPVVSDYTETEMGGLAQRATVLKELREQHGEASVILVEAGDFLFGERSGKTSSATITKVYAQMGYDAVNVGASDFRLGKDYTMGLLKEAKLPVVSTNLFHEKGGKRLFDPYLVIDRGGVKTAVLGITEPPLVTTFLPHLKDQLRGIYFGSYQDSLVELLPKIRKQADQIVVLFSGSAVGLKAVTDFAGEDVDVVATSGTGAVFASTYAGKALLLSPQPHGRTLAVAVKKTGGAFEKKPPVLVGASISADQKIAATVGNGEGIEVSELKPLLEALPQNLPVNPERNRLYHLHGFMKNRAADIDIQAAGLFDRFGALEAQEGHVLLVVRSAWENTIPLVLMRDKGVATTYKCPNLGDHLYTVVNGKHLSRVYAGDKAIPDALPTKPLALPYLGMVEEGTLIFELQDEALESIELRFYDFAHGNARYDLLGTSVGEEKPIKTAPANKVIEAGIYSFTKHQSIGDFAADPGTTLVAIDFRATSQFVIDADATAFDPHVPAGKRIKIGTVADWLEADKYAHLIVDGNYAVRPISLLNNLGAIPRFLPDLKTGNRMVFQIPETYDSLALRADFPNAALPGGELIRPKPIWIEIEGTAPNPTEDTPLWSVADDTITIVITGMQEIGEFGGVKAASGKQFLVMDIDIQGTGEKPEFFQSTKQLVLFDDNGSSMAPHDTTFKGVFSPTTETVWVPNGEHRKFQLVYEVDTTSESHRFGYQGYSLAENFTIASDGKIETQTSAPAQQTTVARVDKNANAGTAIPADTSEPSVAAVSTTVADKVIEESKKPRVVLTPFHPETPKARQTGDFAAFEQRAETMAGEEFLPLNTKSWEEFGENASAIQNQDLEQLNEKEKPVPTPIEFDVVYQGAAEALGYDYYEFVVTEQDPEQVISFYAAVESNEDEQGQVMMRLKNEEGSVLFSGEFKGKTANYDFQFNPGTHVLEFYNRHKDVPPQNYRFVLKTERKRKHQDIEFNNNKENATPIEFNQVISGRNNRRDERDCYVFEIDESKVGKTFALEAIAQADNIRFFIELKRSFDDVELKEVYSKEGKVFVNNLMFEKGKYRLLFGSTGTSYAYHFILRETGELEAGFENEPNDNLRGDSIPVIREFDRQGAELYGDFIGEETDFIAIDVQDANRLYTVSLAGEGVRSLDLLNHKGRTILDCDKTKDRMPALIDMSLPVGLNYFQLYGRDGDWALNVETSQVSSENMEREPNNDPSNATIIDLGEPTYGRIIDNWDEDIYKVVIHQAMKVRFKLKFPDGIMGWMRIEIEDRGDIDFELQENQAEIDETIYMLPGQYWMRIEADDPSLEFYELGLTPVFDDPTAVAGLEYEFDLEQAVVAAHSNLIQQIEGSLRIQNMTSASIAGKVQTETSHDKVNVQASEEAITIAAGESINVPLTVQVASEAWSDCDVFIHANFRDESGANTYLGATTSLRLSDKALPTGTEGVRQSSLMPELIGGINLNALMLGATAIEETKDAYKAFGEYPPEVRDISHLLDGVIENNSFEGYRATVKLAGDGSIPVVGASFDLHGEGSLWRCAKDFKIEISGDGSTWSECFRGTFDAKKGNQQFVFPNPVKASFARLTLLNKQYENEDLDEVPHLGEWRMIGQPNRALPNRSFDVLHEDFGGHLIVEKRDEHIRTYGFHHNRAALLTKLYWKNGYESEHNTKEVKMFISMESPVGPWQEYKTIDVSAANRNEPWDASIPLEEPVWARFVRFEWSTSFSGKRIVDPDQIGLVEQVHGKDGYLSIFADWGDQFKEAGYEYQHPPEAVKFERLTSSESAPFKLTKDETIGSAVSINETWEDWFVVPALEEDRRIQLQFVAKPFIKFEIEITDENGEKVTTTLRSKGVTDRTYVFPGEAGKQYFVHAYEPRRSVVFLWDMSGSMGSYAHSIESAVQNFAQAVNPETEIVQLLPFDQPPKLLLDDWTGEPSLLTNTVRYYEAPSSSYAHLNLLEATKTLDGQQGTKAAIVIADCESGRQCNVKLWEMLEKVKPVVFTFQTSDRTSNYTVEQDDMQDWTTVGGGFYRITKDPSDLDIAFEKVKVFLRRPAPYTVAFSTPELKPGSIQVVDARLEESIVDPTKEGVLLLIDASASMREKLPDGQMKVSAAKKVIEKMVTEYLPPETNFGLRVFGHRGGEDCKSELMLPLAPIDATAIKQKLMFIRSSSLGNTALAEGLSWALEDFKTIEGTKRLVVLTDGEETCQGNPAAEIAKLSENGLEVIVNIVGFTLQDESVKSEYQNWVQSTNGTYYDAQDSQALGLALEKAMKPSVLPPFEVLDKEGAVVATGIVGDDAIGCKSGKYILRIHGEDGPVDHDAEVVENAVTIEYK